MKKYNVIQEVSYLAETVVYAHNEEEARQAALECIEWDTIENSEHGGLMDIHEMKEGVTQNVVNDNGRHPVCIRDNSSNDKNRHE